MRDRLFGLYFFLYLEYLLRVGEVLLDQKLDVLFLRKRSVQNFDQLSFIKQILMFLNCLDDFLRERFVLIFLQVLSDLEGEQDLILLVSGDERGEGVGDLLVLIELVAALAEVDVLVGLEFFGLVDREHELQDLESETPFRAVLEGYFVEVVESFVVALADHLLDAVQALGVHADSDHGLQVLAAAVSEHAFEDAALGLRLRVLVQGVVDDAVGEERAARQVEVVA